MKKQVFPILLFLSLILFGSAQNPYQGPESLPDFTFQSVQGFAITKANLMRNKPVVVIFFDPTCEHCQLEATWIAEKMEKFAHINLLFVSWSKKDEILGYSTKYFGAVSRKVRPGMLNFTQDTQFKIDKWFGDSPTPSIHIFGSDWKHKQSFFNETSVDDILKYAK